MGIVDQALVHYKFNHAPDHYHQQPKKAPQEHLQSVLRSDAMDHIHTGQHVERVILSRLVQGSQIVRLCHHSHSPPADLAKLDRANRKQFVARDSWS